MSNAMLFEDGEILDLDTMDGVYEHVARFLREKGADSDIFCSLSRLKKWSEQHKKYPVVEKWLLGSSKTPDYK